MRRQGAWGIAALVIVASLSNWAIAFHHAGRGAYAPVGYPNYGCAAVYPCCMAGPACGPVGYGPCGGYPGYGCGYSAQGAYAGHSCCLTKIHNHCLAKQARHQAKRAGRQAPGCYVPNGYPSCCYSPNCVSGGGNCGGCGTGDCVAGNCGSGNCGSGDCVSGGYTGGNSSGAIDLPPGAKIISDRILGEGEAPIPAPDQSSAVAKSSLIRLTGHVQNDGSGLAAFERGLAAFRNGSMNDALRAFTTAAEAEPSSAIYHYYRALAMFEVAGAEAAQDVLATAVEAERREGVENWGKRMERVQGRGRLWVETARRDANLVR